MIIYALLVAKSWSCHGRSQSMESRAPLLKLRWSVTCIDLKT